MSASLTRLQRQIPTVITGPIGGTKADCGPIDEVLSMGRQADWCRLTIDWRRLAPIDADGGRLGKRLHPLQLLWFQNACHFQVLLHLLPFGSNLKGEFYDHQFFWVRRMLAGRDLHKSKAHPRLPNSFALFAAFWPQFQCQVLTPQFDLPPKLGG